ncbi:MAG: NADH:flavin oxidoreductase/NADH oxidase [Congregibacter sp.]
MPSLFDPLTIGKMRVSNRIGVSPMSMYSSLDGHPSDFESFHYGSLSIGGASLIFTGTSAIAPNGRISPSDPGLWSDEHIDSHKKIITAIQVGEGTPAVQIGHAGRKASTTVPWLGGPPKAEGRSLMSEEGAWQTVAPSALPFGGDKTHLPAELDDAEIEDIIAAFGNAADRAARAGYELLEIHGGHGYLMQQFLSPIANKRTDGWGGSLENRMRFAREVIRSVRKCWPSEKPISLRMPVEDFHDGGLMVSDGVNIAKMAQEEGVDMIDLNSFGGIAVGGQVPWGTPFTRGHARAIKEALPELLIAGSAQTAPDFNTSPQELTAVVDSGDFDFVLLGRQLLADPHWPVKAAVVLGDDRLQRPRQYEHWLTGRGGRDRQVANP